MTAISDLIGIEVEHLLGETAGPLVKVRCLSSGAILLGQMTPAEARQIAEHLAQSAARAEYEADLFNTMRAADFPEQIIGAVLGMVRAGEMRRHTQGDTDD